MRLPPLPSAAALSRFTPLVVLAIALSVLATLYLRIDEASYKPVFGARERVPTDRMLSVLDEDGIAYRLDPDTGQVLVPAGKLGRARVVLAGKGVTAHLPAGLEQVEEDGPLGTSQFVQQVRFRRALEAELAQSIAALEPVEAARVHLSIARSTSFVAPDGEKSSASVVVTLRPGQTLSKEQIAAVISLVAGSTPNLARERVALVDQRGALLSAHVDLDDDTLTDGDGAQRIRERTLSNIHDLLAPVIGAGNYRASVTAEINADRVEETREQYGEAPKMLNEAVRDERDTEPVAAGVPGTLSNRPVPPAAASAAQPGIGLARNAATRQFTYDRSVMQIRRARGRLEKLSVAVVLNNRAAPEAGKPWSAEQLASIEKLLRGGLGLDSARGDQLVVSSLGFPSAPSPLPWWQREDNVERAIRYGAYGVLGLLGFLLVVRPLLRGFLQWVQHRYAHVPFGGVATNGTAAHAAGAAREVGLAHADTAGLTVLRGVELPGDDSGTDEMLAHVQKLAEKEPERVAEVVKQWIKH
ncbi:flagellar basal-body MS-ring/collar protein FliF [Chitinasiproducens palmae]|uniref:Flagellar M-ring protein n=1 Tax=Chitinasiproducens palmae TaxID=1770053 RepID=A0A1H2PKI6_9BURK|nr:flagellar basal-body MS-ring/collar protein FliF [Chitinasiproducens palmae]SDV46933.1 flagellar M-ring protein FliF [Chitinasiproducens palmae]